MDAKTQDTTGAKILTMAQDVERRRKDAWSKMETRREKIVNSDPEYRELMGRWLALVAMESVIEAAINDGTEASDENS